MFSNEERAHVGTIYKQQGKESAILQGNFSSNRQFNSKVCKGLQYVGPKLRSLVEQAQEIQNNHYKSFPYEGSLFLAFSK